MQEAKGCMGWSLICWSRTQTIFSLHMPKNSLGTRLLVPPVEAFSDWDQDL